MDKLKFCLIFIWICICLPCLALEVTIDRVEPVTNGSKTSVIVSYSGAEKLTFFALDPRDRVFTLDLPGVYSAVDFTQVVIPQVERIDQMPLNPDSAEGIRVRFLLKENVTYDIYESTSGEITLFFEEQDPAAQTRAVAAENTATHLPAAPQLRDAGFQRVIGGRSGSNHLSGVDIRAGETFGLINLTVDPAVEFRTFFLESPTRFVLDLKQTIFALDNTQSVLELPLLKQIRMQQFQSHPQPIARVVLDLNDKANVQVLPTASGLAVAFAASPDALSRVLAQLQAGPPSASIERTARAETQPIAQTPQAQVVSDRTEALEEPALTNNSQPASQSAALDGGPSAAAQPESMAASAASGHAPFEHGTDKGNIEAGAAEASAAHDLVPEPVSDDLQASHMEQSLEQSLASTEKTPTGNPSAGNPSAGNPSAMIDEYIVSGDPEPAAVTLDTTPAAPRFQPTKITVVAANAAPAEPEFGADPIAKPGPAVDHADVSFLDQPAMVNASPGTSSVDDQLRMFLDEDDQNGTEAKPLFKVMDGVRSNRTDIGEIVVTNTAIDKSRTLAEMLAMQEETPQRDVSPEDFETLFRSEDIAETYETIDGGEERYRGFEISVIDVKAVSVVDLLRFIADQVGVNLYVDPSVRDELKATYKFRNLPWDQALEIILKNANLDKEFSNGVLRVATVAKFRQEEKDRADLRLQRDLSVPPETVTFPLSYAKVTEVVPIISQYLSPRGTILMDERTNTLIIEDIPKKMVAIRALIKKLDKMISQVTIEARVVETTKRFLRELGIQWGLSAEYSPELGTNTGLEFPNRIGLGGPRVGLAPSPGGLQGGYAVNFPVVTENPSGIGLSLGNFLDNFKLDISLQMLESDGHGQIISAPKITTQNNKTATIQNGQKIPIQTIQRGTITIRYVDALLELQVTPHITSDETIIMDIVVDKSEPDFTRTVGGNPIINIRKAETRVLVKNGGTAVIGGIFSTNEQDSGQGIPGLRNVPFLKRLFGQELKSLTNQELLIFVTPRIVKY